MSVATLADKTETAESGRIATTTSSAEEASTLKGAKQIETTRGSTYPASMQLQRTMNESERCELRLWNATDGTLTANNTQKHTRATEQPQTTTCKRHAMWRSYFVVVCLSALSGAKRVSNSKLINWVSSWKCLSDYALQTLAQFMAQMQQELHNRWQINGAAAPEILYTTLTTSSRTSPLTFQKWRGQVQQKKGASHELQPWNPLTTRPKKRLVGVR